ncbi:hypothetical protein ABB37_05312 [Leptomonas pyrrhocoris]|uniref:Uncharacterized protein n=1 Tax=Leptomonas pyrrhocoris TaxID=157538 RepID=A0A0M9FZS4_LEPPY|nr:hypothetical protein ABB37_05312 [Leptomonas pyrrhocoris]KPA79480.1 hypothetical protein ABB37_05312 [Leptomonas pyrrhocoris]|eukprot:XP_015657919.1 hypothetical protein ABB37_05312 [Leptomonas pyrrhocoris]
MASAAAARLQDLLQSFISHNLDHGTKKLVPDSGGEAASYTVALDAADMLEGLPFYAAHLRPLLRFGSTSVFPTKELMEDASNSTERVAFASVLQFLGGVVERHLCTFAQAVSAGPSFAHLSSRASSAHTPSSSTSSLDSTEETHSRDDVLPGHAAAAAAAALSGFDGGPRVNFVAWVALEVYRHLAAEAEASLRERGRVGCGAAASDAAVCTDGYFEWKQIQRERLHAALASTAAAASCNGSSSTADVAEDINQKKVAAAPALLPLDPFDDPDDLFTSDPHFFSSFIRQRLLPYVKQHVTREEVNRERADLAEELRHWVRFPASITSFPATCDVHRDAELPKKMEVHGERNHLNNPTSGPMVNVWKRLVQLLLGSAIAPVLAGNDVYAADGLVQPQTPVQVAAYVAAAVMVSLAPGVVGSMTRWLDQIISSVNGDCAPSSSVKVGRRTHEGDAECVEAMHHALDVCTRSVQVVPFPLCDGRDADVRADTQLAGGWLLPSFSSSYATAGGGPATSPLAVRRQDTHGQGLHRQRRAVLLPGLSIAATRISSVACGLPSSAQSTTVAGGAPDAAAPAGTCVVSPAHALGQFLVKEAQLDAAALAPCCDAKYAAVTTPVSALHESSLCCVEWLALFTELPDDREQLTEIRASVDVGVPSGWVVLVVRASVAKATQSWVESTWGSADRPVLLLSAVGQWGLQQLSLRFDVEANTPFTDLRALRGVRLRDGAAKGTASCGVAALLLHSHQYAPSLNAQDTTPQCGTQRAPRRRQQILYTELREQLLFVVGAVACEEVVNAVPPTRNAEVRTSSPRQPLPTTSMFFADSSEYEEEEENTTSSADVHHSHSYTSSGSSNFSTHSTHTTLSSREGATRKMARWYNSADVPPFPFVTRSLLLGAVPRGAQRELIYHFWYWWRLLLHQLVLPADLSSAVDSRGVCGANVAAIRYVDTCALSVGSTRANSSATAGPFGTDARHPRRLHALRVLREALWSYELLAEQHDGAGRRLDEAWAALQRWVVADEPRFQPSSETAESWLQVQSAYVALGNCIDDLCGTVVLAADSHSTDLSFLPVI